MPVFPNKVPDLWAVGPIIEIIIFPPAPVFHQLKVDKKIIPSKKVIALIDTGATSSCINDAIAQELNLIIRNVINVGTPAGVTSQPTYDVGFALPNLTQQNILPMQVLGADLSGQPYQALLGRDILRMCTFVYNGWDNSYQLHI